MQDTKIPNTQHTVWESNVRGTHHMIISSFVDQPIIFNDMGFKFIRWFKPLKNQTMYVVVRCLNNKGSVATIQWESFQKNYTEVIDIPNVRHGTNVMLQGANAYLNSIRSN
jgi:hypothetical protein